VSKLDQATKDDLWRVARLAADAARPETLRYFRTAGLTADNKDADGFDPIDGTRGYISGTPTWGVLISVGGDSGPLMGMIDQPYIGERFMGGFGVAALEGPQGQRELATRPTSTLADAIILTTFPEVGRPSDRRGFEAVASKAKLTRFGMDCYGYALLARRPRAQWGPGSGRRERAGTCRGLGDPQRGCRCVRR